VWFTFYRTATADFTVDRVRLPANQQDFTIKSVQLRVQLRDATNPGGIALSVTAPGQAAVAVVTDAGGAADISAANPALVGATPLGSWHITLTGGAPVTENGELRTERVVSIQLGLEYDFTYPPEP
jgi:hypothetical protein